VAFLEADCVARPGWVRHRIALHRAGHDAVAGALSVSSSDEPAARAWLYLVHPARLEGHKPGPAGRHQSYGLSFTRALLDRAGPFDESLRTDEDTVMAERLGSLGVQPWFDPSVSIEHLGPANLATMLRDQYARGKLDSWEEILRLPAGRLRQRWERKRWARSALVIPRASQRLWNRIRWIAVELHRARPDFSREVLRLAVPMTLGQLAYQIGWITDQFSAGGTGQVTRRGEQPVPSGLRRRVSTTGEAVVALAFAGGPSPQTRPILEMLQSLKVPATFFVSGAAARAHPDLVRAISEAGHALGSAGWSNHPFTTLPDRELELEVKKAHALLEELTGVLTHRVHPPDGLYDQRVVSLLKALGLQIWLWTSHPDACSAPSAPEEILNKTMSNLTPGSVILLHEGDWPGAQTLRILPELIRRIRKLRYRFADLDHSPSTLDDSPGQARVREWQHRRKGQEPQTPTAESCPVGDRLARSAGTEGGS
jgi:peptidoglycan/xylan/chitin deacetylase (PgdA/CDA1 family)